MLIITSFFLLIYISGSLYRFPYLAFENGGAAFLIPYVLISVLCGIPLLIMETALGQFSRKGPVGCWEFAPAMRGIGMASVMISFFGALYYIMIMVWGGLYLVHSFRSIGSRLPWSDDVGNLKFLSACFFFLFIKLLNIIRRSFIQNQYNNNDRS